MTQIRIAAAAALLGVSADTVRRWCEAGRLHAHPDDSGLLVIDGAELAAFAQTQAQSRPAATGTAPGASSSARNRLAGLVTAVTRDTVMAQVEMQCGPFRVVSLMSREAADELDLQPGSLAEATIKSTNVIVEIP